MKNFQFKSQENLSLRQRVMNDIKNAIFQGHLKPGDKLVELDISRQMSVSRGPIREALRDLEAQGLIVSSPYRETTVANVTKEEVVHLLIPVRLQLELFVLKQYLHKLDDSFYEKLIHSVERMKQFATNGDFISLIEEDIAFHELIISLDESSYALQIWSGIVNRLRLHFIQNTRHFNNLSKVAEDHEALLYTLQQKNEDEVIQRWTTHIQAEDCLLCFTSHDE